MTRAHRTLISITCGLAMLLAGTTGAWAEDAEKERDPYKGLTLKLSDSSFIRFITWHQVWVRFTELNPGSAVNGEAMDNYFDIGLRRSRFLALAELNEFQIVTHFGINNQTFNNQRKPQLFMHDVWAQYSVWKNIISVGFGLHYWHGISRMTNASTLNFMAVDAPITNWPTIERTDQFARFLGIWAKGQAGGFAYRVSMNKPFRSDRPLGEASDYDGGSNTLSGAGYFEYQFFDRESTKLPYKVGTYIGKKRVLNLGAGFYYHPNSMQSLDNLGERQEHDQVLLGVDLYADMPIGERESGGALSAYLVFYNYDFGPNHLRSIGIMNVATPAENAEGSANGPGNAYPSIGTGQHVYFQFGYLLPPKWFGGWEFMPYIAQQTSIMEALDDPMLLYEGGLNWFLQGHHAKVTFTFRNRPVFQPNEAGEILADSRASEFIIQTMIFL